jgi:phosphoserine phosphatase
MMPGTAEPAKERDAEVVVRVIGAADDLSAGFKARMTRHADKNAKVPIASAAGSVRVGWSEVRGMGVSPM